jgi:ATP-dependent Clp protease adaptor protein ClpS
MAGPETQTRTPTHEQEEQKRQILPPYAVVLHNDDVNDMAHVVRSLLRSVPSLNLAKATEIMFEAHNQGRARVVVCPLELAELYRDRLQSCRLVATIEKA